MQEYSDVPSTLPEWLVPSSKAHLITAASALSGRSSYPSPPPSASDDDTPGLRDDFDWYMAPAAKSKYEQIYSANKSTHGLITFSSLEGLYASLSDSVPDTDIHSAWNLVNPRSTEAIGKDAALVFLHILSQRHEGYRIPRSVPASLRATFDKGDIDYRVQSTSSPRPSNKYDDSTSTGRKAKFGDTYLSRIGAGSSYQPSGTDFSSTKLDSDWEEVRLKQELNDLEAKIERVETARTSRRGTAGRRKREEESKPALVKRELELMLDYKRKEMRELRDGEGDGGGAGSAGGLKAMEEEIGSVREMVEGLEKHLGKREEALRGLKEEVERERRSR